MKKIAVASGIIFNLCCYNAQDTLQSRNLQKDIALLSSGSSIEVKTPFFQKGLGKKINGTGYTFYRSSRYMG
ncbi:hypothetical protein [Chryseobacterium sp. P1-3]|uniref:hypothetical protein n=1 Tax=Chryseobacterium sp. (strain P1-3) TaxID=1517683 RepID=UPI00161C6FD7|nr:hypothetical protein [Chryseobacterium sp. P1-3]